jgi:hypothetical protein
MNDMAIGAGTPLDLPGVLEPWDLAHSLLLGAGDPKSVRWDRTRRADRSRYWRGTTGDTNMATTRSDPNRSS